MSQQESMEYLERARSLATIFQSQELQEPEICLVVSLKLFPHVPACGVAIFELSKDGNYALNATFGIPEDSQNVWATGQITESSPVVDAMRTGEVICICSEQEMTQRYPAHAAKHTKQSRESVIAVPIRRMGSTVGAFAIIGSAVEVNKECGLFLEIVAGLIALKLEGQASRSGSDGSIAGHPALRTELTKRQLLVQSMMKQGKTNAQIADELGYSESTIRQDAVSMFIKLGVKNRRAAGELLSD